MDQNEIVSGEGVSTDAGSVSTEETETVTADAGVTSESEVKSEVESQVTEETEPEKTEENVEDAEPETTLDAEAEADAEVEVTGVPEGTVTPQEAPVDAEYLAVVNSSGFTKYVLPASEAVENATKGGYSVRVATEDEIADYKRVNKIA